MKIHWMLLLYSRFVIAVNILFAKFEFEEMCRKMIIFFFPTNVETKLNC